MSSRTTTWVPWISIQAWTGRRMCYVGCGVMSLVPDTLVTDAGTEFQGALARLNELFAVQHDVIPDQAKWRLGHAERHGAIMKVMMMKVVIELQIDTCSSKNRVVGKHGVAPLQAVTGCNTPLPKSLNGR